MARKLSTNPNIVGPLAIQNRIEILELVEKGERLIDIAKRYGLKTHTAISNYLADDPGYKLARLNGAHTRLEAREIELENCTTMVEVSKHRDLLSHQRWRCEREWPEVWMPKQAVIAKLTFEPDAGLIGAASELLDRISATVQATTQATTIDQEPSVNEVEDIGL